MNPNSSSSNTTGTSATNDAGGKVTLLGRIPEGKVVESADALPSTPFLLQEITLNGLISLADNDLEQIQGLDDLQSLQLRKTGVTDSCVESVTQLSGLRRLDMGFTKLTFPTACRRGPAARPRAWEE